MNEFLENSESLENMSAWSESFKEESQGKELRKKEQEEAAMIDHLKLGEGWVKKK